MPLLDRLPAWCTSGVGSLPHADPAAAHAVAAYELPFCPQLPQVEGDMVAEWLGADPRRCGWSPARDRERPPAWEELLERLDRTPPEHGIVKLQVTGPATLACALERERGGAPSRAAALALAHELSAWLAANAAGQVRQLAARGLDKLLVVDEPALHLFGTRGLEAAWDPLRAVAAARGGDRGRAARDRRHAARPRPPAPSTVGFTTVSVVNPTLPAGERPVSRTERRSAVQ